MLNLEQRMHQIGKSCMEETKSKMSQPYPVSINRRFEMKSQQLKNLMGIVSENQICLGKYKPLAWYCPAVVLLYPIFKICKSYKIYNWYTEWYIFVQKYKPFRMQLKWQFPTNISPLVNVLTVSFINSLLFTINVIKISLQWQENKGNVVSGY